VLKQCWYARGHLLPSPPHPLTPLYKLGNLVRDDLFLEFSSIGNSRSAWEVGLLVGPLLVAYQQYTSAKVVLPRGPIRGRSGRRQQQPDQQEQQQQEHSEDEEEADTEGCGDMPGEGGVREAQGEGVNREEG
jgi:hypothetical protein